MPPIRVVPATRGSSENSASGNKKVSSLPNYPLEPTRPRSLARSSRRLPRRREVGMEWAAQLSVSVLGRTTGATSSFARRAGEGPDSHEPNGCKNKPIKTIARDLRIKTRSYLECFTVLFCEPDANHFPH